MMTSLPVMLLRTFLTATLLASTAVHAGDAAEKDPADKLIGLWATDKAEAHVEIYRTEAERFNGRIVWLKEPFYPEGDRMAGEARIDRENPDPEFREQPIIGLEIIRGFQYDGDDRWVDGEIYDPENGKTYRCKMWLTDKGTLKVRGYVGISLFGRTTEWTPVFGGGVGKTDQSAETTSPVDAKVSDEDETSGNVDTAEGGEE